MMEVYDEVLRRAEDRLPKDTTGDRSKRLALYERFLRLEQRRLLMYHRGGAGGKEIAQMRGRLIDVLLKHMFGCLRASYDQKHPGERCPSVALVAVGGYGRGDLNPFSDIDILFLHDGDRRSIREGGCLKTIYDGMLTMMFDIGLKVGYSARSVKECVSQANKDMESKTALIESRYLVGTRDLFDEMREAIVKSCVKPYTDAYIEQRMVDQAERHKKFGDTVFLQEPHVKNGCGGLRDFQNLLWMSLFKHGVQTLAELQGKNFVTPTERKSLEVAYDFVLRVRNELHYTVGRPSDVLTLALQLPIATNLGYRQRDILERIECFMRDYYQHTRNIFNLTNALALRMALKPPSYFERIGRHVPILRLGRKTEKLDGFVIRGDMIEPGSPDVFREDRLRMMRVFRYAQQRQAFLSPELQTLIREQLRLVDTQFKSNQRVREMFMAILGEAGNVGRIMRMMHEVGFLGKYMPEFGALDALVQHEFFHRHTADEHTLVTLERLDAVATGKEDPETRYQRLFHDTTRPELLYLALLLHDSGKAVKCDDHSIASGKLAERASRRLGLDKASIDTLLFLVDNHLALFRVSQGRDLDDGETIAEFAKLVENRSRLDLLLLLTFADMTGTSTEIWNEWRDSLLWDLYLKTRAELVAGVASQELQEQRLSELHQHVADRSRVPRDEIDAHFKEMQRRYFLTFTADEILQHLELIHQFELQACKAEAPSRVLEPLIQWNDKSDRGYSQVIVCTWDREGLFSKICGSFSFAGVNILTANAYSRFDGVVLDIFNVVDASGEMVTDQEQHEMFKKTLDGVLNKNADLDKLLAKHRPARPGGRVPQGVVPTKVSFDLAASRTRTVIDVQAEDRLGLLYTISETMAEHNLDINLARISTEKGAAFDTFYVVDPQGFKVSDTAYLERVRIELVRAIERLRRRPIEA